MKTPLEVLIEGHCADPESQIRAEPCMLAGTGSAMACKCIPKNVLEIGPEEPTVTVAVPWLALLDCAMAAMVWLPIIDGAV